MALELAAGSVVVSLDDLEERLLGLFDELGVHTSEFRKLRDHLYQDPALAPAQVVVLKRELGELRERYRAFRKETLRRDRKVRATTEAVARDILERLMLDDRMLAKLDELLALCAIAVEARASILGHSD
jgi:hypothetical protein